MAGVWTAHPHHAAPSREPAPLLLGALSVARMACRAPTEVGGCGMSLGHTFLGPLERLVSRLVTRWHEDAATLRRRGAEYQATAMESCATELEEEARLFLLEALSLDQAEEESGYSYSALQKMVSDGRLLNAGTPHRPRVRRCDLPKKPGGDAQGQAKGEPDLANLVLAGDGTPSHIS